MINAPEYFIAHTIDRTYPNSKIVERWPLHLTVIPPFYITPKANEDIVLEEIAQCGLGLGPIKLNYGEIRSGVIPIEIGNIEMFGPKNDIPVVEILDPSNRLHELHSSLLSELGRIGCKYINLNPDWAGDNYSPHATTKGGVVLDHPFLCDTLTLCAKTEGVKKIIGTIKLHK
jgi:2'-5' RNA ligase